MLWEAAREAAAQVDTKQGSATRLSRLLCTTSGRTEDCQQVPQLQCCSSPAKKHADDHITRAFSGCRAEAQVKVLVTFWFVAARKAAGGVQVGLVADGSLHIAPPEVVCRQVLTR